MVLWKIWYNVFFSTWRKRTTKDVFWKVGSSTWASHFLTLAGVKISFFLPGDQTLKLWFFFVSLSTIGFIEFRIAPFFCKFSLICLKLYQLLELELLVISNCCRWRSSNAHRYTGSQHAVSLQSRLAVVQLGDLKVDNVLFWLCRFAMLLDHLFKTRM